VSSYFLAAWKECRKSNISISRIRLSYGMREPSRPMIPFLFRGRPGWSNSLQMISIDFPDNPVNVAALFYFNSILRQNRKAGRKPMLA
jgi:hypothetical protein